MSTKNIILGIALIGLSILDAYLTGVALSLGAIELNPVFAPEYRANMWLKGLVTAAMVAALLCFKQGRLLKWLVLVMLFAVIWNYIAISFQEVLAIYL